MESKYEVVSHGSFAPLNTSLEHCVCEGTVASHSNMDVMMPVASPMSALAISEQHQGACMISGT